MNCFNRVILIGHLTRDPQLRKLPSGASVADLGLAVNESANGKNGSPPPPCFVDITAWEKKAEACAEHLSKGSQVMVEGRLQLDRWEKDGQKFSKLKIRADRILFLNTGARKREEAAA